MSLLQWDAQALSRNPSQVGSPQNSNTDRAPTHTVCRALSEAGARRWRIITVLCEERFRGFRAQRRRPGRRPRQADAFGAAESAASAGRTPDRLLRHRQCPHAIAARDRRRGGPRRGSRARSAGRARPHVRAAGPAAGHRRCDAHRAGRAARRRRHAGDDRRHPAGARRRRSPRSSRTPKPAISRCSRRACPIPPGSAASSAMPPAASARSWRTATSTSCSARSTRSTPA